ncbi:MAG: pseudouridine-5'-phosphate glycosidase [Candidatus Cloacimonetes bacterium]|nr:pseudouridine-5'-phosphate glycosidase [Candidatus Cloacimonadota bacterium]
MAEKYPFFETLPIRYSGAVQDALNHKHPVIALESTVITHGLPFPQNIETARRLEQIADAMGVVPATIIVLDGEIRIGLAEDLIRRLSPNPDKSDRPSSTLPFNKLSLRDLPGAIVTKASGGTTVSATMAIAHYCGIQVFATGGIGGVHRGWQVHPDISTDLIALSRIPVMVISAGCKAILDISATLEVLETLGVPVYGWRTASFPAFYTRHSGYGIPQLDEVAQIASAYRYHLLQYGKTPQVLPGMLIANPIPVEHEIPADQIEPLINYALAEAQEQGIRGKALTPFLLAYLAQHSHGESVDANLALLENNVRLAGEIARQLVTEDSDPHISTKKERP